MSATTVPSAWESMVEAGKRVITRRRVRPPHDDKWSRPKEYAWFSLWGSIHLSLPLPLVAIAIPHPLILAATAYSFWTTYQTVQNLRRTYKAANLEAENRILGRNQLPVQLPTTPKRSMADSFNGLSHMMLNCSMTAFALPSIFNLPYEEQKKCIQYSGITLAMAGAMRGASYLMRRGDNDDNNQPPKPPRSKPPTSGGPA